MLGGSDSGINFLSLRKFEGTFCSLSDEVPGTEIRHDVWTNFTESWKGRTLLTLNSDCQFLLLDCIVSINTKIPRT